jgi:hypothetical protein
MKVGQEKKNGQDGNDARHETSHLRPGPSTIIDFTSRDLQQKMKNISIQNKCR